MLDMLKKMLSMLIEKVKDRDLSLGTILIIVAVLVWIIPVKLVLSILGIYGLYGGYEKHTGYLNNSEEPTLSTPYFLHLGLSIPNNYEIYIDRKYLETRSPHSGWIFQIISLGLGYKF